MKVIREVWQEEDGIGVVEIILILVILRFFESRLLILSEKPLNRSTAMHRMLILKLNYQKNNNSLYFRNSVERIRF